MSSLSKKSIANWKYPKEKFVYEKQVLLRQTNLFGNTYYSNYIEWQGEARERFLLEHPAADEFFKSNKTLRMITHSLYHRFDDNTYFGDRLRIEVTAKSVLKYSFMLVFEYFNAKSNKLVGHGWQKIGFYDELKQGFSPVPQLFLDLLLPVLRPNKNI